MRRLCYRVRIAPYALICIAAISHNVVAADATSFVAPSAWTIGTANSTYQEWDVLTAKTGNAPDIGHAPALFAPTLSAASPAFLTGSHNLYAYAGDYQWWADIENYGNPGPGTDVIVQVAATLNAGVSVYPDSLSIVQPDGSPIFGGDNASALRETILFEGQIWVESQGTFVTTQERLWEFFLPDYTGDFRVAATSHAHSSLMQVRVDSMITTPVPEPGANVLAAMGLIALGVCRIIRHIRRREI